MAPVLATGLFVLSVHDPNDEMEYLIFAADTSKGGTKLLANRSAGQDEQSVRHRQAEGVPQRKNQDEVQWGQVQHCEE